MMNSKITMIISSVVFMASCSWFDSGSMCSVSVEAKGCDYIEIQHEQNESESSKEAEVPM